MQEETPETPKFSVYKTETTKQFFVKYDKSPEKEISELEYNNLVELKNKMLDSVISEPVMFEAKDNREITKFKGMNIYKTDAGQKFEYKTCYGLFYLTADVLVVDTIFNSEKGNGEFLNILNLLHLYSCFELKKTGISICNLNEKLIDSIQKKMKSTGKLVASNTLYFDMNSFLKIKHQRFIDLEDYN